MKYSTSTLVGLLSWLSASKGQRREDILTAAMQIMGQQAPGEARTKLTRAMLKYEIPVSFLPGFFSKGTVPPLPAEMRSRVPDWVRSPLARGEMSGDVLDLLVHRRNILQTQVERSNLPSSNLPSKHIRQVWYGLLLGQGGGEVEEVDRVGLELISVKVQPLVQGAAERLRLDSLPQVGPPTHSAG